METNVYAGFVACEWDRSDILSSIPSATWMGENWSNPFVCDYSFREVRDLWHANRDCLSLSFHGVGHEYWLHGRRSRSEFYDRHGRIRDLATLKEHFEAFYTILEHNGISIVPELFIPPALKYNIGHEFSELLTNYNIRYVITRFSDIQDMQICNIDFFHASDGIILFERGRDPVLWNEVAAKPTVQFAQPILPLHWANILHADSARNSEVVDLWIQYIREGIQANRGVLTRNIRDCMAQYAFLKTATLAMSGTHRLVIDLQKLKNNFNEFAVSEFMILLDKSRPVAGVRGMARYSLTSYNEGINIFSFIPESNKRYCVIDFIQNG